MKRNAASLFWLLAGIPTAKPPVSEPHRVPTGWRANPTLPSTFESFGSRDIAAILRVSMYIAASPWRNAAEASENPYEGMPVGPVCVISRMICAASTPAALLKTGFHASSKILPPKGARWSSQPAVTWWPVLPREVRAPTPVLSLMTGSAARSSS